MDSQLICDFYNMDLGVEQGSKVDPLEAVRKKILKFFRKYCPEILDPSLLPDEIDAKHFMGFDVDLWFSGEPLRVRRINPADPPHAHFVLFQRHWSRVVELINNFVDHQKLTGSDWNWLRKKLLMVPIRFFELPKGVLVDQGMLDRPKVGYSRGVGLVDREGKTIVGPNMYMEAEFKVVSLDEHKLGYTEYFSANTAWEMISEILYEVTHLMI